MLSGIMSQIIEAKNGISTPSLRTVAQEEGLAPEDLQRLVASGKVVIPANERHAHARPVGIGLKLRTKVNVNIGTSADYPEIGSEAKIPYSTSDDRTVIWNRLEALLQLK